MLIAHLPAGYLLTAALVSRGPDRRAMWVGLVASVAPDLDLLYFYFFDHGRHLHHGYWSHIPFTWLCLVLAAVATYPLLRRFRLYRLFVFLFLPNFLLHLLLDTVVGDVRWLFPFSSQSLSIFEVPAVHDWWVYNFVFHWTFLFEVFITVAAIFVLLARCGRSRSLDFPARFGDASFGLIRRLQRATIDSRPDSRLSRPEDHEPSYPEVERSSSPG